MKQQSVNRTPQYWLVLGALVLVSVFYYGIRAAAVCSLAAATAVLTDFFCLFLRNKPYRVKDLSGITTALVLALMLPASVPYSIVILSTAFAVAVGAHVFGNRGTAVIPPAAAGYLFALIGWKNEVLRFPPVGTHLSLFGNAFGKDGVPLSPSLSSQVNAEHLLKTDPLDLLLGAVSGPMGTGCILLLLAGAVVLLFSRDLSLVASVGYIGGILVTSAYAGMTVWEMLPVNMLLFSMLFLACNTRFLPEGVLAKAVCGMVIGHAAGFLIVFCNLEYAPVVAVVLCSPLCHAYADEEARERAQRMLAEKPEETVSPESANAETEASVPDAAEEPQEQPDSSGQETEAE